jgi:hypothetical protein
MRTGNSNSQHHQHIFFDTVSPIVLCTVVRGTWLKQVECSKLSQEGGKGHTGGEHRSVAEHPESVDVNEARGGSCRMGLPAAVASEDASCGAWKTQKIPSVLRTSYACTHTHIYIYVSPCRCCIRRCQPRSLEETRNSSSPWSGHWCVTAPSNNFFGKFHGELLGYQGQGRTCGGITMEMPRCEETCTQAVGRDAAKKKANHGALRVLHLQTTQKSAFCKLNIRTETD